MEPAETIAAARGRATCPRGERSGDVLIVRRTRTAPTRRRARCLNNTCRLPEGQCENNTDCANGEQCVDGACEGGGGGGGACQDDGDCVAGETCLAGQCISPGGGLPGGCASHADCGADEQCLLNQCLSKCNTGTFGQLCSIPPPLDIACICRIAGGLTCNQQTGYCE